MNGKIKNFAEKILGIEHDKLKKRTIFIKFIVIPGKVIFDPELFVSFEKNYGEDSLYHKDIADANSIERGKIAGGAFVAVSHDNVKVTGFSTDFGSITGYEEIVKTYFSNYFDYPVEIA
jgi:hypothetical protein